MLNEDEGLLCTQLLRNAVLTEQPSKTLNNSGAPTRIRIVNEPKWCEAACEFMIGDQRVSSLKVADNNCPHTKFT
jgi:hypothetical protein